MMSSSESALRLLNGILIPRWLIKAEGSAAAEKARAEVTKAMVNIVKRRESGDKVAVGERKQEES